MKIILIPIIVFFLSQTLKFVARLIKNKDHLDSSAFWVYMWASGAPSTHSAVLVSSLYLLYLKVGLSEVFAFCLFVVVLVIYNLLASKKKEEIIIQTLKVEEVFKKLASIK